MTEACPVLTEAFDLLGKRWTGLILDVLARGPARFTDIHRAIRGLSSRVLGERLRELTEAEVVRHCPIDPTRYELTPGGQKLVPALDALRASWTQLKLAPRTGD
jgi:DNA-binding HxlR family transcriptional regulator